MKNWKFLIKLSSTEKKCIEILRKAINHYFDIKTIIYYSIILRLILVFIPIIAKSIFFDKLYNFEINFCVQNEYQNIKQNLKIDLKYSFNFVAKPIENYVTLALIG